MIEVLTEFIQILVGGIVTLGTSIGTGIGNAVESMFLVKTVSEGVTTYSLSTFGGVLAIFAGISLAVGLTRLVYMFITSLGAHH